MLLTFSCWDHIMLAGSDEGWQAATIDKAVQLAPTWDAELELVQCTFEPQADTGPAALVCCIVAAARLSIDRSERFRVDGIGAQHESC
jgi:hypothetical protein